jgi:hypothetical protein
MWISDARLERLEKRISELESWKRQHTCDTHFIVYEPNTGTHWLLSSGIPPHAMIRVQDVVARILDKLGMQLTYVKGQPERVEIHTAAVNTEEKK